MIRVAKESDASRIAEIQIFAKRTAYRHIFQNDKVSFGEMQVVPLAAELLQSPKTLAQILVYDDEFVKAMANIRKAIYKGKNILELNELYVDTFFQGQGISGVILKHLEQHCKSNNLCGICLWVLEKNKSAIAFYEAHGFIKQTRRKAQPGTPEYLNRYYKPL